MPQKKILIEKFTGHKCSYCPDATRKIKELKEFYGDAIIPIAIHPGGLDFTITDDNFTYDFTTISGDAIVAEMGGLNYGLPIGSVNRTPSEEYLGTRFWTKNEWSTQINNLLFHSNGNPIEKKIHIELNTYFDKNTKELNVETNLNIETGELANYHLCLIIVEDSIISPQIDGIQTINNYEHNYIYRCAVNSTFGQIINEPKQ